MMPDIETTLREVAAPSPGDLSTTDHQFNNYSNDNSDQVQDDSDGDSAQRQPAKKVAKESGTARQPHDRAAKTQRKGTRTSNTTRIDSSQPKADGETGGKVSPAKKAETNDKKKK
jgi:hypothetical protein